jgi:c-di-GMP-binding flagellar brake protein YcgR
MLETLEIGKKIAVRKKLDGNKNFSATIQNLEQHAIYITQPYNGENPLILMRNEQVEVKYVTENGAFVFSSAYLGMHQETEVLRLYKISVPADKDVKKVQLRNFVRVPLMIDVEYLLPDSEEVHKGTAVDLSAGGMRLATKNKLSINQTVNLYFKITKRKKPYDIRLRARVVRTELIDQQINLYHSGLQFLDVNRGFEDSLVCFVFEKQMEQLRKR